MRYSLPFLVNGGVGGTIKTVAAVIVPDVAGNRFRIRGISLGGSSAPADQNLIVRLRRIIDLSAGTPGVGTTVVLAKRDTGSVAATMTAKTDYTAGNEPTAFAAVDVWSTGFNQRGSINKEWDEVDAPVFTQDQLAGLSVYTAGPSVPQVQGTIEIEEF